MKQREMIVPCIIIKPFCHVKKIYAEQLSKPGISVRNLIGELGISEQEIRLIFIDGVKSGLNSTLQGGERIGIFLFLCGR